MDKTKINGISSHDLSLESLHLKKIHHVPIILPVVVVFVWIQAFFPTLTCSNLLVNFYAKTAERLCVPKTVKECEISFFCARNRHQRIPIKKQFDLCLKFFQSKFTLCQQQKWWWKMHRNAHWWNNKLIDCPTQSNHTEQKTISTGAFVQINQEQKIFAVHQNQLSENVLDV